MADRDDGPKPGSPRPNGYDEMRGLYDTGVIRFPAIEGRPPPAPVHLRAAGMRDPTTIPPREWLLGSTLLARYVSVLISPGGIGKTTVTLAQALALATGRPLLGDHVFRRCRVAFLALEDDDDELDRRLAGLMLHFRIEPAEIEGWLFAYAGRSRRLVMAAVDPEGNEIVYPDRDGLIAEIRRHAISVVVCDPFLNSHSVPEGSNEAINEVARSWVGVANDTGCAVWLVHHTRKGAVPGDPDSGRGASALAYAARVVQTLAPMSPEEAEAAGVEPREARRYVRLDDAKANLAPKPADLRWLRLGSVELGNGTPAYPLGDSVQSIEPWRPAPALAGVGDDQVIACLREIAAGPELGGLFTPTRRGPGGGPRWVGHVMARHFPAMSQAQIAALVGTWIKTGLLREAETRIDGKTRAGVTPDMAKAPGWIA